MPTICIVPDKCSSMIFFSSNDWTTWANANRAVQYYVRSFWLVTYLVQGLPRWYRYGTETWKLVFFLPYLDFDTVMWHRDMKSTCGTEICCGDMIPTCDTDYMKSGRETEIWYWDLVPRFDIEIWYRDVIPRYETEMWNRDLIRTGVWCRDSTML